MLTGEVPAPVLVLLLVGVTVGVESHLGQGKENIEALQISFHPGSADAYPHDAGVLKLLPGGDQELGDESPAPGAQALEEQLYVHRGSVHINHHGVSALLVTRFG